MYRENVNISSVFTFTVDKENIWKQGWERERDIAEGDRDTGTDRQTIINKAWGTVPFIIIIIKCLLSLQKAWLLRRQTDFFGVDVIFLLVAPLLLLALLKSERPPELCGTYGALLCGFCTWASVSRHNESLWAKQLIVDERWKRNKD